MKETIQKDIKLINKALKKYISKAPGPAELKNAMIYSVYPGGKRIRPVLTLEAARACGEKPGKAMPLACAIELIHSFSLVHDDLPSMDNDDLRRGKPSCHKKFGEAVAILAGDALLCLAFNAAADLPPGKAKEAVKIISNNAGLNGMTGGQALDIKYEKSKSKNQILSEKINTMKTASLMSAACALGGIAAGAPAKKIKALKKFGTSLGLAFQAADDMEDGPGEKSLMDKNMNKVSFLISRAKKFLKPFGQKKDMLIYISESVVKKAEKSYD